MKKQKRLKIDRETIKQLSCVGFAQGGVKEERCRTLWWQESCVPNAGASIAPEQTCSMCFAGCQTGDAC